MLKRRPETVVLVDDSTFDNKLHRRVIERTGLVKNILTFSMADDALDYMRGEGAIPVDLILLDINMPRMDGFELLEAAQKEFGTEFSPSVVVMLTTSLDARDRARADSFDVIRDYFMKPLTGEAFVKLIERLSDGSGEGAAA